MAVYDVVIAGLGPTGLTLGHLLGRRGMSVLILEREPEFYGNARAVYTDDETLRVFQTAGVAEEIHVDMNVDSAVRWVKPTGEVLVRFHQPDRPLSWPVINFLYQPYLETKLEALLERYPHVEVRRGREVVDFAQDGTGVTVLHDGSSGNGYGRRENAIDETTRETVRASFLIGADGGRSVVRLREGIEMTGTSFPERWLVVDLNAKGDAADSYGPFRHLPYFDFICDPQMPTVSCPQPGGHHRFEFALGKDDDAEHFEADETVRELLSRHVDVNQVEIRRQLVYTFNALVADRWRDGRVLLAGDAAHMTPQFVGQGMNAGVRDADNLSWKLEAVLRHGADPGILDTFEAERRPHAKAMIDFSVFNKSLVSLKHPAAAHARNLVMRGMQSLPGVGSWIRRAGMKPKPRLKRGSYLGLPRRLRGVEGTLAPQPVLRTYEGRPVRLDDEIGIGWAVIGFGVDPRDALAAELAPWRQVGAAFATIHAPGARPNGVRRVGNHQRFDTAHVDLEDAQGDFTRWLHRAGAKPGTLLVLRPDKYVFGLSSDAGLLTKELVRQLGISPTQSFSPIARIGA